jgi:hypothetical protein
MTTNPNNLSANDVLAVVQQRFPREYEIAVQQVYIRNLEASVKEGGGFGVIEEPDE